MGQIDFQRHKTQEVTQEEIDNLNNPMSALKN